MRRTRIGFPRAVLVAGVVAAFAVLPAGAGAEPSTFFAAPEGSGDCTEEAPCEVRQAVSEAQAGDTVRMLPENGAPYLLPYSGLEVSRGIDIGGVPGAPVTVHTTSVATIQVLEGAGATVHDIRFEGAGNLQLESGTAERVYVSYVGGASLTPVGACELGPGTTLRDSVCWAAESAQATAADGVSTVISTEKFNTTVSLRNVTAIASDASGHGFLAGAYYGAKVQVDAGNVIAKSAHAADVAVETFGAGSPTLNTAFANSNFATLEENIGLGTVTPAGSGTNQTEAPLFANPATGDFHELDGSPTLDAGAADPSDGALDLDGAPRAQPGCAGAAATPDIGAYELDGTGACPPPKPQPVNPGGPDKRIPVFRIVKVAAHGAAGTVQIEVPSAGMLSLTGSGIKLITRATGGPGVVKLPLKPWAITLARLKKSGKTKVRVKVRFAALGAAPKEKRRTVVLHD